MGRVPEQRLRSLELSAVADDGWLIGRCTSDKGPQDLQRLRAASYEQLWLNTVGLLAPNSCARNPVVSWKPQGNLSCCASVQTTWACGWLWVCDACGS